ncbi:MAG: hypothetical protein GXO35_08235 [Gammaproteobacteria bacterium]|nr:hypothetical protein [Gammaproteobacteria bacterium]
MNHILSPSSIAQSAHALPESEVGVDHVQINDLVNSLLGEEFSETLKDMSSTEIEERVLNMLVDTYSALNAVMQKECEVLLNPVQPEMPTEESMKLLLGSKNPYVREAIASRGFFSEVLKDDPVGAVRLAVLKKTGRYSEHFRRREDDLAVIREMLVQGLEVAYFEGLDIEAINELISEIKTYTEISYKVNNFDVKMTELVIDDLTKLFYREVEGSEQITSAIQYLKINLQNSRANFLEITEAELALESDEKELLIDAMIILKGNHHTPFGEVVKVSEDFKIVGLKQIGSEGIIEMNTVDLMSAIAEAHEAES